MPDFKAPDGDQQQAAARITLGLLYAVEEESAVTQRRLASELGIAVGLPSVRFVFLTIGFLPWPVANYVWLACPGWLAVLLTLYVRTRRTA